MKRIIHARKNATGEFKFRIWSYGCYVTDEMTEPELRRWELKNNLQNTITSYYEDIDFLVKRVIEKGTSSLLDESCDLFSQWDEEEEHKENE
jgi:hypothetical protein